MDVLIMPFKGKEPRCKCGHAYRSHKADAFSNVNSVLRRSACQCKDCDCKLFRDSETGLADHEK